MTIDETDDESIEEEDDSFLFGKETVFRPTLKVKKCSVKDTKQNSTYGRSSFTMDKKWLRVLLKQHGYLDDDDPYNKIIKPEMSPYYLMYKLQVDKENQFFFLDFFLSDIKKLKRTDLEVAKRGLRQKIGRFFKGSHIVMEVKDETIKEPVKAVPDIIINILKRLLSYRSNVPQQTQTADAFVQSIFDLQESADKAAAFTKIADLGARWLGFNMEMTEEDETRIRKFLGE